MNFIIRNKQLFGLAWAIIVIIFYKFYNDYVFTDTQAITFIVLLIVPVLFLELMSYIKRRKNLTRFNYISKQMYEQIKLTVEKEFIPRFKNIYSWHEFNKKEMQFAIGNEDLMLVRFEDNKTSLEILGTNVKYNLYYGKTLKGYQKYDKHGFEYHDVQYLYSELYSLIMTLLEHKVRLENYYTLGAYKGCKLFADEQVVFEVGNSSKFGKTIRKKEINF